MQDHLFVTNPTIVFCGETNEGKTTTINNIITSIIGEDEKVNFFVSNCKNATKILTIFSFIAESKKPYLETWVNGDKKLFIERSNLKELCEIYNSETIKSGNPLFSQHNLTFCQLYLPTKYYNELKDLLIIDTIGETLDNKFEYQHQMRLINTYFPNSNYIAVTKELNNSHKQQSAVILTHFDLVNYDNDSTKKEKHKEFLNNHPHVLFVDNVSDSKQKSFNIDGKDYRIYTKQHYIDLIVHLYYKYKDTQNITLYDMKDYATIIKSVDRLTKEQILAELRKFNNRYIYEEFEKHGFCLTNVLRVCEGFDQKMANAAKMQSGNIYRWYQHILNDYISENMGAEYIGYDYNTLRKRYFQTESKKLRDYLTRLYLDTQRFSGVRREREE